MLPGQRRKAPTTVVKTPKAKPKAPATVGKKPKAPATGLKRRVNIIHSLVAATEEKVRALNELNMLGNVQHKSDIDRFARAQPVGVTPYKPVFDLLPGVATELEHTSESSEKRVVLVVANVVLKFLTELGFSTPRILADYNEYVLDYAPTLARLMNAAAGGDSQVEGWASMLLNAALKETTNTKRAQHTLTDSMFMDPLFKALPKLDLKNGKMVIDWLDKALAGSLDRQHLSVEEGKHDEAIHRTILKANGFDAILSYTMRDPDNKHGGYDGVILLQLMIKYLKKDPNTAVASVKRITRETANWDEKGYSALMRGIIIELLYDLCSAFPRRCCSAIASDTRFIELLESESRKVYTTRERMEKHTQVAMKKLFDLLSHVQSVVSKR